MSHHESVEEKHVDEVESSSDDSEQMNFILGEAAAQHQKPTTQSYATPGTQTTEIDASFTTKISVSPRPASIRRIERVSPRILVKSMGSVAPERTRPPKDMLNSQAKFGTRLRNPELSGSTNSGRVTSMDRAIQLPQDSGAGSQQPHRMTQRSTSTPVPFAMRGPGRIPTASSGKTLRGL